MNRVDYRTEWPLQKQFDFDSIYEWKERLRTENDGQNLELTDSLPHRFTPKSDDPSWFLQTYSGHSQVKFGNRRH